MNPITESRSAEFVVQSHERRIEDAEQNIQAYLDAHVYHGRHGRKMDNG